MAYPETPQTKAERVDRFLKRNVVVDRNGNVKEIPYPATFWTVDGRKKILKKIKGRLNKLVQGYDLSYQITLTYRGFSEYSKGDLRRFLNSFFRVFAKRKIHYKYFWVAEFQKRGMIHYHLLVFVKRAQREKYFDLFDKERIDRLWNKGYTFVTVSSKTLKKAYNYAVKYLLKTIKKDNDKYFDIVLAFREIFGSFRLYGMSKIKRWGRSFRRKDFLAIQKNALYCKLFNQQEVLSLIDWSFYVKKVKELKYWFNIEEWINECAPWLWGLQVSIKKSIVPRYKDIPLEVSQKDIKKIEKTIDKEFGEIYNKDELVDFILEGGF